MISRDALQLKGRRAPRRHCQTNCLLRDFRKASLFVHVIAMIVGHLVNILSCV